MSETYEELFEKIGKNNFQSRFKELLNAIQTFLTTAEYPDYVYCNEDILNQVLLDYYSDIARLKEFHKIKHTKTDKVMAYTLYWFLKRKPIQIDMQSDDNRDVYVNERCACSMLFSECLLEDPNLVVSGDTLEKYNDYIDLILYYFKYRELNPQVIELMIESFKTGWLLGSGNGKNSQ